MTVITDLASLEAVEAVPSGAVFILGHFDGVHLGHRSLLERAKKIAGASPSAPIAVWTLSGLEKGGCLTTEREKLLLLRAMGAGFALTDAFSEIRDMEGGDFFRGRIAVHRPAAVICGYNFTFGRGASCHAEDLCRMARGAGIACSVVPPYTVDGEPVSSTEIRRLVLDGEMEKAAERMGRPYPVSGTVRHGHEIGRTMGFPTANLRLPSCKIAPPHGVYASVARWERAGAVCFSGGVSNLGSRPTVNGDCLDVTLETNLFSDPGDLYGLDLTVWLLKFLRPERKFASVDELGAAIARDGEEARQVSHALWSRYEDEFLL